MKRRYFSRIPRRGQHARIVRPPASRLLTDLKLQLEQYRRREFEGLSPNPRELGRLIDTVEIVIHHICDDFDRQVDRDDLGDRDEWQGVQTRSARELQRHAAIIGVGQFNLAQSPADNPIISALLSNVPLTDTGLLKENA